MILIDWMRMTMVVTAVVVVFALVIIAVFIVLLFNKISQPDASESLERTVVTGPEVSTTAPTATVTAAKTAGSRLSYLDLTLEIFTPGIREGKIEFVFNKGRSRFMLLEDQHTDVRDVILIPHFEGGDISCTYTPAENDTQMFTIKTAIMSEG